MHILHVVTRLGLGGAERVVETLARGSTARGHEVTVFPIAGPTDASMAGHLRDSLRASGAIVVESSPRPSARVAVIGAVPRLVRTVARTRPGVVHLHTEIPEFAWAMASLTSQAVRRTPIVRTIHNSELWGGWGRLGGLAESRLDGAGVAAVSAAAGDAFVRWRASVGRPARHPKLIYNGIDLTALPSGPGSPSHPPLLGFAGRFERQKGIDILLESVALLAVGGPPFRVAIHGAGRLEPLVAAAAERWPDRVSVGPPIPDLSRRLGRFDAILMPSRFEGLGLLAVEAMCVGIPVLATQAPGLDEVFPPEYPGRCQPGDAAAYADLMADYLANEARWRAQAAGARQHARERFAMPSMVDAYEQLYEEVSG